jgi:two-component system, sensor histidine kinase YesM
MVSLIVLLLVPILALYTYSNQTAYSVVKDEIYESNKNQMLFFAGQMEQKIEEMGTYSILLIRDRVINEYQFIEYYKNYTDVIRAKNTVTDRLGLQKASSGWIDTMTVYAPKARDAASTDSSRTFAANYLTKNVRKGWHYDPDKGEFVWFAAEPASGYENPLAAKLIIEIRFSQNKMIEMLENYKSGGNKTPFLYDANYGMIDGGGTDRELAGEIVRALGINGGSQTASFNQRVEYGGKQYLANAVRLNSMGWYVVEYVPLEQILSPIVHSRNLFYAVLFLLLLLAITAASFLYRNFQMPMIELIKSMQRLKRGDFAARIAYMPRNEFSFIFERFNDMARQIQDLIEKVYTEKLHSREATLKQLQSQINPHFLYNCLFFIKNMTRLGDGEAVEAMAVNLGEYYRYTTRHENQTPLMKDEVGLLTNYLEIQNLRLKRIRYEIDIPESMMNIPIPRLLLQPIVENAIIHGIEPKVGEGTIRIAGVEEADAYRLIIEDNGVGLSEEKLQELRHKLNSTLEGDMGCGMWNVNQRLVYQYGEGAGLALSLKDGEGLRVSLSWPKQREQISA